MSFKWSLLQPFAAKTNDSWAEKKERRRRNCGRSPPIRKSGWRHWVLGLLTSVVVTWLAPTNMTSFFSPAFCCFKKQRVSTQGCKLVHNVACVPHSQKSFANWRSTNCDSYKKKTKNKKAKQKTLDTIEVGDIFSKMFVVSSVDLILRLLFNVQIV